MALPVSIGQEVSWGRAEWAGTLGPSLATVHLRPQRGDAEASWPVGKSGWEGRFYSPDSTQ